MPTPRTPEHVVLATRVSALAGIQEALVDAMTAASTDRPFHFLAAADRLRLLTDRLHTVAAEYAADIRTG